MMQILYSILASNLTQLKICILAYKALQAGPHCSRILPPSCTLGVLHSTGPLTAAQVPRVLPLQGLRVHSSLCLEYSSKTSAWPTTPTHLIQISTQMSAYQRSLLCPSCIKQHAPRLPSPPFPYADLRYPLVHLFPLIPPHQEVSPAKVSVCLLRFLQNL